MLRSTGRHGALAARLHRLERATVAAVCAVCGGVALLVVETIEDATGLIEGGRCRGCGAPMKVVKGIDPEAV